MIDDKVIKSLKELIECYEIIINPENAHNREIHMWRKKFLDEIKCNDKMTYMSILYMTSKEFMEHELKYYMDMMNE